MLAICLVVRAFPERVALPPTGGNDLISFAQFYTCVVNLKNVVPCQRFYCFRRFFRKFVFCLCDVSGRGHNHFPWQDMVKVYSDISMLLPSYHWHIFAVNSFYILNKCFHLFLIFVQQYHVIDMPHHGKLSFVCPLDCDTGVV